MQKTVYRLEQALSYWEDFCFSLSVTYQVSVGYGQNPTTGMRGLLVNYPGFRQSMLDIFSANAQELADKYMYPKEACAFSSDVQPRYFPYAMLCWSRHSRRVFSLSRDLQALLDATSLEGVIWGDVKLPFESFVVTLEQPLIDGQNVQFDCVLVARLSTEQSTGEKVQETAFIPFDSRLENYRPYSRQAKEWVTSLLEKGSYRKADRARRSLFKGSRSYISTSIFTIDSSHAEMPISKFGDEVELRKAVAEKYSDDADAGHLYESVLRIIVGMCLYLKTLPVKTPFVSEWEKLESHQTQRGRAITDKAEVCTVSSQFKLSAEEHEVFGGKTGEPVKSFGEKCCHFRRGTWCRPSGYGDDPDCPKTIWRRPTIVRPDKLVPGELPKGAETILLK